MTATTLATGDLRLDVRPELGGAVTRFECAGAPLLRPTPADAAPGPACAAFVMAPFPNRIAYGRFDFDGVEIRLPPDPDGAPHALHGEAWRAAWAVISQSATAVEMVAPQARAWPWRYTLRQRLDLSATGLDVAVTLRNDDDRDMPADLGWHPAFARRADAEIHLDARAYLPTGQDLLPTQAAPLPPRWDFSGGRPGAAIAPIDTCLVGWSGHARIVWPDVVVAITARDCTFLQVYATEAGDFVCLEPQTCAPDAVNRGPEFGMRRLAPGQAVTLRIRIDVTPR